MAENVVDVKYLNGPELVIDYLNKSTKIAGFFQFPNYSLEQIVANGSTHESKPLSHSLISGLLKYNEGLSGAPVVRENILKLADPRCRVVVTGQQAGLLTGAAFVIYKAASAIVLAKELEHQLNKPVVPLFWIASEDHDFLEVNSCSFYLDNKLVKKKIEKPIPGMPAIGEIPVSPQLHIMLDELLVKVESKEGRKLLLEIKEQAAQAKNMAELFGLTFSSLFGSYGLIMIDSMQPSLRAEAVPLIRRVFGRWEQLLESIKNTGSQLQELGYSPAFNITEPNQFPMFCHLNNQREPIYIKGLDKVEIGKNKPLTISFNELQQFYENQPELFSPNAFLRPLIQDYIFSTIAYVAGPGEINYFAQLKESYRLLDVSMPVIYPRARVTVIGQMQWQLLSELSMSFPIDYSQVMGWQRDKLEQLDSEKVFERIKEEIDSIAIAHQRMASIITEQEPALQVLCEKNIAIVRQQLKYLYSKTWQRHRKKHRQAIEKLEQLYGFLHPQHREQEMVLNIISLIAFFDDNIIPRLMTSSLIQSPQHHKLLILGGN